MLCGQRKLYVIVFLLFAACLAFYQFDQIPSSVYDTIQKVPQPWRQGNPESQNDVVEAVSSTSTSTSILTSTTSVVAHEHAQVDASTTSLSIEAPQTTATPLTTTPVQSLSKLESSLDYAQHLPQPTALPLGNFDPMSQVFDVPADIVYDPAGPRPEQVIVLTATDGKGHNGGIQNILESTAENRKSYCEKHGYINQFVNISKFDLQGSHPVWGKLPAIIESFQTYPDAQWLWWLDLDAIIMNPTVSLNQRVLSHTAMHQTILFGQEYWHDNREGLGIYAPSEDETKFEDLDLLISQDHNGLNAGSFMIRKSLFSRVLMDVWRDPFLLQSQWPGQEQESLMYLIRNHPTLRAHVGLIHQRTINAYAIGGDEMGWREGDLAIHFAGCWVEKTCQKDWTKYWDIQKKSS